ncbi:phosphotransferase [Alkalicella caledoniensis]|uniref:Phosphotransferase n=1 Tax=Alkalicella caledoniensis TaxID=2731377 RepID=A0A7G9WBE2_ALKCA|nr:phosphotransferase [Alkalicella caledoniensis]QNO16004.1 phosphotransferase [Alkalicella caledoniensis]
MEDLFFLRDIPEFDNWVVIKYIDKGWSEDKKFYIKDKSNNEFLLRLSEFEAFEHKRADFERLLEVSKMGFDMSMPLRFGVCGDGRKAYMLLTWVKGEDAIEVLPRLDENLQYKLGLQGGKILKKIHSISAPSGLESWEITHKRKIDRVITKYLNCGVKIQNHDAIINYIRENEDYIKDRPLVLQHGDFHVGNMLITSEGHLGIIDFNRSGYGDPWDEYDRYMFTWDVSEAFANGQLHGYFNYSVPDEFFRVLCLYNARNILASIPWSIPFGRKDLDNMLVYAEKVSKSYKGFTTHIPTWYKKANT